MHKATPLLALIILCGLVGSNLAYGDYTDYINMRIPQNIPNVCIFEAEEAQVNFQERDFYNKTVNWIQEGWIDNLNNYTNSNNWDMTFEYIPNATHYDMKLEDFPQCHIMIVWDAENDGSRENLGRAQGYTAFDHSKSVHKYTFIDVFTWAPINKINLGLLQLGNYTQNEDGTFEIPLTEFTFEYEEVSDEGTTIANSGHRSTYSDYSLGKEADDENKCEGCGRMEDYLNDDSLCEDCKREAGIDRKESERDAYEDAPDDIDPIFGTEDSTISVAGPPAGTQPPANMFDDEEDEDKLLGEAGTNPEESWNLLSDYEKEGKFGDWLSGYSDDESQYEQYNYGRVPYDQLPQGFKYRLGESKATEQNGWWECSECGNVAIKNEDKEKHEYETGHNMEHMGFKPALAEQAGMYGFGSATGRMSPRDAWEQGYAPDGINPIFQDFRTLHWSEIPSDMQELWKSELEYLTAGENNEEFDTALLIQLLNNELEEEEQGHDETEDIAIVANLLDRETSEEAEDFKEEEHPREEGGKFTSKGGGVGKKAEAPKPSKTKPSKIFNKAKDRALRIIGEPKDDYDRKRYNAVKNLDGYPQHSSQLRDVPAGAKASIMKSHLADTYGGKWSARKKDYNSIDAGWKGGSAYPYGAGKLVDVYSNSGSTNSQVDYFDTDTYVFGVGDDRPKEERGKYDGSGIADSREHRFAEWIGNWAYSDENPPESSIDPNKLRWGDWVSIAGWKLKGDSTGFQDASRDVEVKFDDLNDLQKQFEEQEKKEGGAETPKETPKSTTPAFYTQQYMGEDPDKPQEIPINPTTIILTSFFFWSIVSYSENIGICIKVIYL